MPNRRKVFDKTFLPAGETQPVWATLPLDQKIPVCPSPRGAFTFYTNKLGEPKYISNQRIDFDLTNPQGRDAPQEYDSLTDPSLRSYFTSPRTKRHLFDNGLVTQRGEIVCNVKEFNEYRSFIRYRSVTELSLMKKMEKRMVQEEKDAIFLEWPNVHKKRHRKKEKRAVYSEPPRRPEYHVSGLDMYKEDLSANLKRTESRRRNEESRRSQRGASTFSNQKLSLVEEMRRREQQLKNRLEEQRRERDEEHKRRMEENWKERQIRQEKLLAAEAEMTARAKEERNQHIMEREKTISHQRTIQDKKLQKLRQEMGKGQGRSQNNTQTGLIKTSSVKGSQDDVSTKGKNSEKEEVTTIPAEEEVAES